jgi:hypothetical protein
MAILMKGTLIALLFTLLIVNPFKISAQDDLMELLGDDQPQQVDYAYATFKTSRIVIGHSVESPAPGVMLFMISHHFGQINSGAYEFFGLDQATIRLGFEYGINDWMSLGIGRSSYEKTYDGFAKFKILRQSSGLRTMPLTVTLFSSIALNSLHWQDPERENYFTSRLAYTFQLLMARKFTDRFSFQLTPSLVHKNLVETSADHNDIFLLGGGGRYKITKRISVNAEYHYVFDGQITQDYDHSLSLGIDIETGGHVFQVFLTNSYPLFERGFLTETVGKWSDGEIYLGFNISRVFTIVKPEKFKD